MDEVIHEEGRAPCAQPLSGIAMSDALVAGALRAQISSSMLPFAGSISLFDRWQPSPDGTQVGFVELVIDFSGYESTSPAAFGLHRFSFPYGGVQDRQESVRLAREGGLKLMDAYGLPIHDFLAHVDGEVKVAPAVARLDLVQTMREIDKAFGLVLDGSL